MEETTTKQLFISFALKDAELRDQLIEQINKESPELTCVFMPEKDRGKAHGKKSARKK